MPQKASAVKHAQQSEVQPHQLDRSFLKPFCPKMSIGNRFRRPPSVRLAVVVGQRLGARPLHNQGQSTSRREADAS